MSAYKNAIINKKRLEAWRPEVGAWETEGRDFAGGDRVWGGKDGPKPLWTDNGKHWWTPSIPFTVLVLR